MARCDRPWRRLCARFQEADRRYLQADLRCRAVGRSGKGHPRIRKQRTGDEVCRVIRLTRGATGWLGRKLPSVSVLPALIGLLLLAVLYSVTIGRYDLSVGDVTYILIDNIHPLVTPYWEPVQEVVVEQVRLPRIMAAVISRVRPVRFGRGAARALPQSAGRSRHHRRYIRRRFRRNAGNPPRIARLSAF